MVAKPLAKKQVFFCPTEITLVYLKFVQRRNLLKTSSFLASIIPEKKNPAHAIFNLSMGEPSVFITLSLLCQCSHHSLCHLKSDVLVRSVRTVVRGAPILKEQGQDMYVNQR